MSSYFSNEATFRSYLQSRSEVDLRNKLYRMQGGAARMNGCKTVLVDRVLTADRNLTMDQRRTIFRDLENRRNTRRTRIEPNMQSIGAGTNNVQSSNTQYSGPQSRLPVPFRVSGLPDVGPPISSIPRIIVEDNVPLPTRSRPILPLSLANDVFSPRPRRNSVSAPPSPLAVSTPRHRHRSRSISSAQKIGGAVSVDRREVRLECKVCMEAEVNTALLPCGHACLCYECSLTVRYSEFTSVGKCPICRRNIREVVTLYFS